MARTLSKECFVHEGGLISWLPLVYTYRQEIFTTEEMDVHRLDIDTCTLSAHCIVLQPYLPRVLHGGMYIAISRPRTARCENIDVQCVGNQMYRVDDTL